MVVLTKKGLLTCSLGVIVLVCLVVLGVPSRTAQSAFASCRLPDTTLVIDPGHGGEDGGAISISGKVESEINLSIALRLDALMGLYGVPTVMTRTEDISIYDPSASTLREKKVSDIHNRVALVESIPNATLLSIHQNSYPDQKYKGMQVFYANGEQSLPLAQQIQDMVRICLDPNNQRQPLKIPSSVYLMNHVTCPAILVECGFLSNPEEDQQLQEQDYQMRVAATLAAAFLQTQNPEG